MPVLGVALCVKFTTNTLVWRTPNQRQASTKCCTMQSQLWLLLDKLLHVYSNTVWCYINIILCAMSVGLQHRSTLPSLKWAIPAAARATINTGPKLQSIQWNDTWNFHMTFSIWCYLCCWYRGLCNFQGAWENLENLKWKRGGRANHLVFPWKFTCINYTRNNACIRAPGGICALHPRILW